MRTPLVIAMWEPMARALGYPRKRLGFADILKLATSNQGWAAFGRPEFGAVQARPHEPGLLDLRAVGGRRRVLLGDRQEGGPDRGGRQRRRRPASASATSSARSSTTATRRCSSPSSSRRRGPGYATAVAMEEVTLVDFNRTRGDRDKLVAIYPSEGTFYSDNPFFTLNAPGCPTSRPRARRRSRSTWRRRSRPRSRRKSGFRPSDRAKAPVAPITAANGADPKQPERVLGLPEPRVLARIKEAWRARPQAREHPARARHLGLDERGGPAGARQAGARVVLPRGRAAGRVGLTIFSDRVQPLVPTAPLTQERGGAARPRARPDRRRRDGVLRRHRRGASTPCASSARREPHQRGRAAHRRRGHGLVSSASTRSCATSRPRATRPTACACSRSRTRRARPARVENLKRIAAASGGMDYEGKTEDIESVYRSISCFF